MHFQSLLLFHFKEFANIAEVIFKGSDRRSDIDKAYGKLLQVMFDNIERISYEHEKIPPEIIMFGKFFIPFSRSNYLYFLKRSYRASSVVDLM